jgi:predicted O-linked N-acetylglucosamine transferase (SPINDLY family)
LPFIDYLIADKVTIPPELQHHYREKICADRIEPP